MPCLIPQGLQKELFYDILLLFCRKMIPECGYLRNSNKLEAISLRIHFFFQIHKHFVPLTSILLGQFKVFCPKKRPILFLRCLHLVSLQCKYLDLSVVWQCLLMPGLQCPRLWQIIIVFEHNKQIQRQYILFSYILHFQKIKFSKLF